jgi:hypothetical protein
LIDSRDVSLFLFAVTAGEAAAFLLGLWVVLNRFDEKLKAQAERFGEKMDVLRRENRDLRTRIDVLTDFLVASGINIQAGEDVNIGRDVIGRDKFKRTGSGQ